MASHAVLSDGLPRNLDTEVLLLQRGFGVSLRTAVVHHAHPFDERRIVLAGQNPVVEVLLLLLRLLGHLLRSFLRLEGELLLPYEHSLHRFWILPHQRHEAAHGVIEVYAVIVATLNGLVR